MLVSLPIAWMYLLPNSIIDFSKSILYSIGFTSNYYFHYTGQLYGAQSGLLKPFLHTWSLSVEEQYYILFPILMLITFKYFQKYLIYILVGGFLVSFDLANWTSQNYPSLNFYLLPTRGWELLAGSILAYYERIKGYWNYNKLLNSTFPFIGMMLIIYSIIFFNDKMYNSIYTLLPVIGVCLIIWFSNKDELVTKILSSKLFVGIGLISYSLYLWHYPIFAFGRITEFTHGSFLNKLILGIIILILSILSYFFVERPARNKKRKFKVILGLIIIFISALVIFNFKIIEKEGYKNRLPEIINKTFVEAPWKLLKNSNGDVCHQNVDGCVIGNDADKKIYIIGDSQMGSLIYDLNKKILDKKYQLITLTYNCFWFPGFDYRNINTKKIDTTCNDKNFSKIKNILKKEKNSIIIFGGRFPLYISKNYFDNKEGGIESRNKFKYDFIPTQKYKNIQEAFKKEVIQLSKENKIILIYPIPEVGWNPNNKIYLQWIRRKDTSNKNFTLNPITTSYTVYKERTKASFIFLDDINSENIYRIYPHKLFCSTKFENRCITHDQNKIYYYDDDHLSIEGSEILNTLILNKIQKIE